MKVLAWLRSHQSTWPRKLLANAVSLKEEIPSRSASISVTMGTVPRETSVSTPMIRSYVRRLFQKVGKEGGGGESFEFCVCGLPFHFLGALGRMRSLCRLH